jgi:polynucleotide 5'-hydroxyl-kinase GRC3/NOL9
VTSTDVPESWRQIDLDWLHGSLLVVGAPDTGKTTFARYLFGRLLACGTSAAYIDGDPGQNQLGPPSTMTLVVPPEKHGLISGEAAIPAGKTRLSFVGSTTPVGHMLSLLTGAALLERTARECGAQALIFDSDGLVDPSAGGLALKLALIDLLRPAVVFAMQRERELEALLTPLRLTHRTRLVELRPSPAVESRSRAARRDHRTARFSAYFETARLLRLNWSTIAVLPYPRFSLHRLVALEDSSGFTLALGIVKGIDRQAQQVTLFTPLSSPEAVDTLRLGNLSLDADTFRDRKLS